MAIDPRTPVLVGAGVAHQRHDDPSEAVEALELMALAVGTRGSRCRCIRAARAGRRDLCPAGHVALPPTRVDSSPSASARPRARSSRTSACCSRPCSPVHASRSRPASSTSRSCAGARRSTATCAPASPDTRSPTRSSPTAPYRTRGSFPNTRSCRSSSATRDWSMRRGNTRCSRPRCARRGVNRSPRTRARPVSCGRPSAASRRRTPTRGDETR